MAGLRMSLLVSPAADTDIPDTDFPRDPRDTEVDLALARVRRNPVMKTLDKTGLPAAKRFKGHKVVADAIAQSLSAGEMFAFVQAATRGYWASEWTVSKDSDGNNVALRRRAGRGSTVTAAVDDMLRHPSFHSSHYFRPDEGLLGWYKRK